jgi:hypothetical protein
MSQFKVKYKTRQRLQRAIQQEIRLMGLIDDGTMLDSVRVSAVAGNLNKITITVNAIYYYVFQDLGAPRANIRANDITQSALMNANGKRFLKDLLQDYSDFLVKKYNILNVAKLKINPDITVQYNLFGDDGGRYNGMYVPSDDVLMTWNPI